MYFVFRGVAEVMAADNSRVVTQLGNGSCFGEVGFLFGKPRLNSVRAQTHCELLVIDLCQDCCVLTLAGR
eukprot:m.14165 g.14165  ORF g.14165 m.14165 type:complete len:70 (-) comp5016_c0_seq1:106-315(-)